MTPGGVILCSSPRLLPYVEFEFYKNDKGSLLRKILFNDNVVVRSFEPFISSNFNFFHFNKTRLSYIKKGFFFDKVCKKHYRVLDILQVPCGKCVDCLKKRSLDFACRAVCQIMYNRSICSNASVFFVTLTISDLVMRFNHSLSKRDLQLFFKRLRKVLDIDFKYFSCGEYGAQTFRPHYHFMIIFNTFVDYNYFKKVLSKCWSFGLISCDETSDTASICYVARYCDKKIENSLTDNDFKKLGVVPPFILISQKLGLNYFLDHIDDILYLGYIQGPNGQKFSIPSYFFRYIDDLTLANLKNDRRVKSLDSLKSNYYKSFISGFDLNTFCLNNEIVKKSKKRLLKREL